MTGIIYCALNVFNGKRYIGQSIRPLHIRQNEHFCFAFKKQSKDPSIRREYKDKRHGFLTIKRFT